MIEHYFNKKISLEKIVEKMCHNPAILFNIKNRGFIREGFFADLVIFDSDIIIDKATYEKPLTPALGIDTVINNGQIVWQSMKSSDIYSGKFLEGKSFN